MKAKYSIEWLVFVGAVAVIVLWGVLSNAHCAVLTTYAKHYSDSARVHPNRRYHPDSMNVAVGWRELYGQTLWLTRDSFPPVKVTAKDVMNKRFNDSEVLCVDASPAVMKALGLKGKSKIIVTVDIEDLLKRKIALLKKNAR